MKKNAFLILSFFSFLFLKVTAQSVEEGVKYLYYEKNKSAQNVLEKAVEKKSKDAAAIYWLGQAYLADDEVEKAKALYQKALNEGVNDPYIWVGMGHVELLEGRSADSVKQRFGQAIAASKNKKGVENADILTAIGRANADGSSDVGDPEYAIALLKKAQQIDTKNPEISVLLGINYLKTGPENGGKAVEAFLDAATRNPQYAKAYARIGRVYQSQDNKTAMDEWYVKAINTDPIYGPVYYYYFDYYKDKDVNAAKEFLDKYLANSDKDCRTQFFAADYLFRAGKYQESIQKADSMSSSECSTYARLPILYAYNYQRLGDSVKAKDYIQKFFATVPPGKIEPADYNIAGIIYKNVSGYEDSAVAYISKAMELDTVKKNKLVYIDTIANIYKKLNKPQERLQWVKRSFALVDSPSNRDIYDLADAALQADSLDLADSMYVLYETKYPEQIYGWYGRVQVAQKRDTTGAAAVAPINELINNYYMKDTVKNAATIAYYHAILGSYYANYAQNFDSSIYEFEQAVRFDPNNAQYQQYLTILKDAKAKAEKAAQKSKSSATKPKSSSSQK